MRLVASSIFLVPYALASSDTEIPSALSVLPASSSQPQIPYLELRELGLDRRQIQPAAVGAPAQAAAGATLASAPNAPQTPVTPTVNLPVQTPVTPIVPGTLSAAVPAPAVPAPAAGGGGGVIGGIPVTQGPGIAQESQPPPKSGQIGLGTLTGKIGVVRTDEARSDAVLTAGNRFGFIASWPSAIKVGASLLLGMALGAGIFL